MSVRLRMPHPSRGASGARPAPASGVAPRRGSAAFHVDGGLTIPLAPGQRELLLGGKDRSKQPAPPPAPAPAPTCPTSVSVAQVFPVELSEDNVRTAGIHTGMGAIAEMLVSDPSGRDWAGTQIHENITGATNSCTGTANCTNQHGQGGQAGSTFTVGEASAPLPAKRNTFYDWHIMGLPTSVLHANNLTTCQQTCTQFFDCGGARIGSGTLTITRDFARGRVANQDVSLITLSKGPTP